MIDYEARSDFTTALRQRNLELIENVIADSQWHYCRVIDKSRSNRDGRYKLFDGKVPFGLICNWTDGRGTTEWHHERAVKKMTDAEYKQFLAQQNEARRQAELELEQVREEARVKARSRWRRTAKNDPLGHPYLKKKKIKPHGIRQDGDHLIVPMYDAKNELHNLQRIWPDGKKLNLKGGLAKGLFFPIEPAKDDGGDTVAVAEGFPTAASINEACGHRVYVAFGAGNLIGVALIARERHPNAQIIIAADDDGQGGIERAADAARAVGGMVAIPEFGNTRRDGERDFNDIAVAFGHDAVRDQIKKATKPKKKEQHMKDADTDDRDEQPADLTDEEFQRRLQDLAGIPKDSVQYGPARRKLAKESSRSSAEIEKLVNTIRVQNDPPPGMFQPIEPWKQPVDGATILDQVWRIVKSHIFMPDHCIDAIALWIVGAYCHDAFQKFPILLARSPTKRCGKTLMLNTIAMLVPNPLQASSVTGPAVFRVIDLYKPTMLIDEIDTFLADKYDIVGILNSSFDKNSAYVMRCVGDDSVPTRFSTWTAFSLAGIGRIPATVEDRSITIQLVRKSTQKAVTRLPKFASAYDDVRRKLARWAQDNIKPLSDAEPVCPSQLHDRERDRWEPLFAIADLCGGKWGELAREAACKLSESDDDEEHGIVLLTDIKRWFDAHPNTTVATSGILVDYLKELEAGPWGEFKGKAITTHGVAKLLKPYKIFSKQIRVGKTKKQGYRKADFERTWDRYVAMPPDVMLDMSDKRDKSNGYTESNVGHRAHRVRR